MKFLLLICSDSTAEAYDPALDDIDAWVTEMDRRGVRTLGERVRPPSDAKTIKRRAGELVVKDGPFTDAKERIGGFDLIECADMAEAIEIAARHPMSRLGQIEVRPIWEM
jgi:hypothetical protein